MKRPLSRVNEGTTVRLLLPKPVSGITIEEYKNPTISTPAIFLNF